MFVKIIAIFYERRNIYCFQFQCFERIGKYDLNNTKLVSQFCRNKLKIEQNCITQSLTLVQNYMWNLAKILVSKFNNH